MGKNLWPGVCRRETEGVGSRDKASAWKLPLGVPQAPAGREDRRSHIEQRGAAAEASKPMQSPGVQPWMKHPHEAKAVFHR